MRKLKNVANVIIPFIGMIMLLVFIVSYFQNSIREDKVSVQQASISGPNNVKAFSKKENQKIYKLELNKWNVFNDGTHPVETTKGINNALKWANKKGFTTFTIPEGIYLIAKGKSDNDPNARINLVSNMTFLLDDKAVLQKETNGFEIYSTLYLDSDIENVSIKGGTLRGDRDTHDYSTKGQFTEGSHEWGNGISTAGASNIVIDGVTIEKFTGDGIEIGGATIYGNYITDSDLEYGGINDKGQPVVQKGKIRSKNYKVTNFSNAIYQNPHYRNLMMWIPEGVKGNYDLVYYKKDGSYIKKEKDQHFNSTWGFSHIPKNADYFRVVFNADSTKDVIVNRMTVAVTENMTIKNCNIGYNRRQGITVGASDDVKIINNMIHDTKGTAPQSGIDIEPGFYPALKTSIKGNQFLDNKIHIVFAYGGKATVEGNYFGPNLKEGLGFSINESYYGATVKENKFEKSSFVTWGNTKFINNHLKSSSATFEGGSNVFVDRLDGIDSNLDINQTEFEGIKVNNVKLNSSKQRETNGGISVYGKPIHMRNIILQGNSKFSGDGNSKSVYDKVSLINTPEMSLPIGKYNECSTKGGILSLNTPGKIQFNKCKLTNTTIYTYNVKTEATIQQSTVTINRNITDPIFLAIEAKKVSLLNNFINVESSKKGDHAIIQIGRDASENDPTKVFETSIIGNKIKTKISSIGIDTLNGGVGSSHYLIEKNTLKNASLSLREDDINLKNKVYKK